MEIEESKWSGNAIFYARTGVYVNIICHIICRRKCGIWYLANVWSAQWFYGICLSNAWISIILPIESGHTMGGMSLIDGITVDNNYLNALAFENFITSLMRKISNASAIIERGHLDPFFFFFVSFSSTHRDNSSRIIPANLHESHLHEIAIKIYLSRHYGRDYGRRINHHFAELSLPVM